MVYKLTTRRSNNQKITYVESEVVDLKARLYIRCALYVLVVNMYLLLNTHNLI